MKLDIIFSPATCGCHQCQSDPGEWEEKRETEKWLPGYLTAEVHSIMEIILALFHYNR